MSDDRLEAPTHRLEAVSPGDTLRIRDSEIDVVGPCRAINPPDGLISISLAVPDPDEPLTKGTVSELHVDREPYELSVCNGETHEIDPNEVEIL